MKTLQLSAILAVFVTAGLAVALVIGAIDSSQLKTTLSKSLLVIGIAAMSSLVVVALANSKK